MTIRDVVSEANSVIGKIKDAVSDRDYELAKTEVTHLEKVMEYMDEWVQVFYDSIGGVS